ncbi:helix-turn-helix domain-containing protein [Oceanobacillus rekensis]|uniref:helix-turn-helix domain-containing protein n=1 Tax=Oceanobacillus rekensis TaxID=937927 RepID=UPI000B446502|nr:helix-turn-helix domain-containing protein [Oceanobacillus rekensis]
MFDGIILTCIDKLQGERTASSIYHLLKGKKSIQTVQDAHIYHLEKYYGIYNVLTKERFNNNLSRLVAEGLLNTIENEYSKFQLSTIGVEWLEEHKEHLKVEYFNGLTYNKITDVFYLRLLLLIQTLTNAKMNYFRFIPVTDNHSAERWVKQHYQTMKTKKKEVIQSLYDELYNLLDMFPEQDASLFVDRLTGYQTIGLSTNQLSEKYMLTDEDVHLLLTGMVHRIITTVHKDKEKFSIHAKILNDLSETNLITHSANKTNQLLKKSYTINQIAAMRNLKTNTIHDHIVEIALYDSDFPLDNYISAEDQKEVITVLNNENSFKLKDIKESLNENISYFQIRLVLAVNKKVLK